MSLPIRYGKKSVLLQMPQSLIFDPLAFRYKFLVDDREVITVPYGPITDEIRHNRGFVDLRGRPNLAKEIVEAKGSKALRNLLVRLASPESPIFTIGCDLGSHQEPTNVPQRRREVAGGYVQIANLNYYNTKTDAYAAFARSVVATLEERSKSDDFWELKIEGRWVNFELPNEPNGIHPSLWFWFFAAAPDPWAASEARERFLNSIEDSFMLPESSAAFSETAEPQNSVD